MTKLLIRDAARPSDELILEVDPGDWYDEDEPELTEEQAEQVLAWWCGDLQRGYTYTEDGGYIAVVDATDGKCLIEFWSQETSDETWPLTSFPYSSIDWRELGDE